MSATRRETKGAPMGRTETTRAQLEAELAYLKDRQAIVDRLTTYCHCIDYGDAEGWVDCFTEDASWKALFDRHGENPQIDLHGRAEFRAWYAASHAGGPSGSNHFTFNPRVMSLDGDEAAVLTYYMTGWFRDDIVELQGTGRYVDKLVRCRDGQWRIAERENRRNVVYTT
jgi:3-phenylpropionate/cinnamic acid dioxygenase small subunit